MPLLPTSPGTGEVDGLGRPEGAPPPRPRPNPSPAHSTAIPLSPYAAYSALALRRYSAFHPAPPHHSPCTPQRFGSFSAVSSAAWPEGE
jgi:hypothetical protein